MTIKIKDDKRYVTLHVKKGTTSPVQEVLSILKGVSSNKNNKNVLIDLSGMKPSKVSESDLEELFVELPNQPKIGYVIALPDTMVRTGETLARDYSDSIVDYPLKPRYKVMNKNCAIMLNNQNNRK